MVGKDEVWFCRMAGVSQANDEVSGNARPIS